MSLLTSPLATQVARCFVLTRTRTNAVALVVLLAVAVKASPVFLEVADANFKAQPQAVLAGQRTEFVLTLTAATAETPELSGDLAAIAGGLAAPLFSNRVLGLQRLGEARAGIQRFKFELEIPVAERMQLLLLRLRIRPTTTESWLPLPPVALEASPRTWRESLRLFAKQVHSGRLAGNERLTQVFQQAKIEIPERTVEEIAASSSIRVWFAVVAGEEPRIPDQPQALWVVFKKNVRGGLEIRRATPDGPLCVTVDASALAGLDTDATAQELFERALTTVRAVTLSPLDSIPSQP